MNKCENIFWSWWPQTESFSPTQLQWWSEKWKGRDSPLRGSIYLMMCLGPPQFLFLTTTGSHFGGCSLRPLRLFLKEIITGSGAVRSGTNLPGLTFPIFRRNVPPSPKKSIRKRRQGENQESAWWGWTWQGVNRGDQLQPGEPEEEEEQVRSPCCLCAWEPFPLAPASRAPSSWPRAWRKEPPPHPQKYRVQGHDLS